METLPDGSVFIDADPDVFTIVLNYMRRPSTYPLLWTCEKGFDYVLYNKVMAEADFYMLEELRDWVASKEYENAVKIRHKIEVNPATTEAWMDKYWEKVDLEEIKELVHCYPVEVEGWSMSPKIIPRSIVCVWKYTKMDMSVCYKH